MMVAKIADRAPIYMLLLRDPMGTQSRRQRREQGHAGM